jgi:hypothetical protein
MRKEMHVDFCPTSKNELEKRAFLWAMVRDSDCEINGLRKKQSKVWMIVGAKKKRHVLKL